MTDGPGGTSRPGSGGDPHQRPAAPAASETASVARRGTSLQERVNGLPQGTVQRVLGNALTRPEDLHMPRDRKGWGFAKVTRDDLNFPGEFMNVLRGDRWYHCPDNLDGMSEAYGVAAQVECLRGSTAHVLPTDDQKKGIASLHSDLRKESKVAWAQEAVVMGIGRAKQKEYDKAIGCYDRALELQPDNVDAMVAKGAALANLSRFRDAVSCFEKALGVDPNHANAKEYLRATRDKVNSGGQSQREAQTPRASDPTRQPHAPSSSEAGGFNLKAELQEAFAAVKRKMARKERKSAGDDREKKSRRDKKQKRKKSKSHRKSKRRRRSRSPGTDSASDSSQATD